MRFLKTTIGLILLGAPLFALSQADDAIEWSSDKRLSWDDYLAKPASSSAAAAITSTAIGIEYHIRNNLFNYSITCRFSKSRSWGKFKTNYILGHEQGHFDITEIYARKLAKELKAYTFNPRSYQSDVNKIYKRLMQEKEDYQNEYDKETDFSRNQEKQTEWLEKIKRDLEDTEDYANYQSPLHL